MNDNKPIVPSGGVLSGDNQTDDTRQRQATENIILNEIDQIFDEDKTDVDSSAALSVSQILTNVVDEGPSVTQESQPAHIDHNKSAIDSAHETNNTNVPTNYAKSYHVDDTRELNQNVDWEKYHRAWQDYYQKYYEYYFHQGSQQIQAEYSKYAQAAQEKYQTEIASREAKVAELSRQLESNPNFNPQNAALNDLKAKIRAEAVKQTRKIRKSRHFWPITAALVVVLIFLFLQYNQIIVGKVMAYIAPGNMNPDTIVVDPTISIDVGTEPILIVPKLNIEAPVAYDVPNDNDSTLKAMENGLAHYCIPGACAHPGEIGNTVISGHRTNGIYQTGDYKFIFLKLDQLQPGDIIYANYNGKRYTYSVTSSELVAPSDVHKVIKETNKPLMTLVTCHPIGSAAQRLLVHAEQIAPDPTKALTASQREAKTTDEIPGKTESLWQSIFGN